MTQFTYKPHSELYSCEKVAISKYLSSYLYSDYNKDSIDSLSMSEVEDFSVWNISLHLIVTSSDKEFHQLSLEKDPLNIITHYERMDTIFVVIQLHSGLKFKLILCEP